MSTENTDFSNGSDVFVSNDEVVIKRSEYEALQKVYNEWRELDLENNVLVNRDQFAEFLSQNAEYKADIIEMVNVFQVFAGLFEGKGVMSVIPVITKMMKDKTKMAELSGIVLVIDKYTTKTAEING